jgi:hypothetical protein
MLITAEYAAVNFMMQSMQANAILQKDIDRLKAL